MYIGARLKLAFLIGHVNLIGGTGGGQSRTPPEILADQLILHLNPTTYTIFPFDEYRVSL